MELNGYWLDLADVGAIGRLCSRGRIQRLTLTSAALTPTYVAAVLPAVEPPSLWFLDLSRNALGDEGAAALAQSPGLRSLYQLNLSSNGIGPDGVEALADSPYFAGLEEPGLQNTPLGTNGGRRLVAGGSLGSVRRLLVQRCGVGHLWQSLRRRFETVVLQ